MRKLIYSFTAIAAIFSFFGCKKDINPALTPEKEKVTLSVNIVGDDTKATASSSEAKVSDVQLFVFDAAGKFESKATSTGTALSVNCVTGQKTIVALINAPAINPTTLSALNSTVSNLTDNSLTKFVMLGSATPLISANSNISIQVKRLVSKVSIQSIKTNFTGAYATQTFIVKAIYLINVAGNTTYALASPTTWYNKLTYSSSAANALVYDGAINATVANGSTYNTEHVFYPYPNPTNADSSSSTWSARHTRLVVEATLGGETGYYTVTLPVLERNKTYTISELTITRTGADNPDEVLEKDSCSFTISVSDWEVGMAPTDEEI